MAGYVKTLEETTCPKLKEAAGYTKTMEETACPKLQQEVVKQLKTHTNTLKEANCMCHKLKQDVLEHNNTRELVWKKLVIIN